MGTVKHITNLFFKVTKVLHFACQAVSVDIEQFCSKIDIMGFERQKSTFLKIFFYDVLGRMLM